ncbi:MAG: hypothetical protein FJ147_07180 [Deltaproteobacteria bacterium]|nr:hypothetical protein [Deltaproteobacteria bacterium]
MRANEERIQTLLAHSTEMIAARNANGTGRGGTASAVRELRGLTELRTLSTREWEVLQRLWNYQCVQTIAKALFVSLHTVRNHLKSIFRKAGVHPQPELLELLAKKPSNLVVLNTDSLADEGYATLGTMAAWDQLLQSHERDERAVRFRCVR